MNNFYSQLRSKKEQLQSMGSSGWKLNFYKTALGILECIIILTQGAGSSFPLIFQTQGPQTVTRSYKEFKTYQRKARIVFLLLVILIFVAVKLY